MTTVVVERVTVLKPADAAAAARRALLAYCELVIAAGAVRVDLDTLRRWWPLAANVLEHLAPIWTAPAA